MLDFSLLSGCRSKLNGKPSSLLFNGPIRRISSSVCQVGHVTTGLPHRLQIAAVGRKSNHFEWDVQLESKHLMVDDLGFYVKYS